MPSFNVAVDTRLTPRSADLPAFPDGIPRPLATLTDKSGKQIDFVENELMVEFATQEELKNFLIKWQGTVLAVDDPRTVGIAAHPTYLIRVQTGNARLENLRGDLSRLNPNGGTDIAVNSEAGRRLIAAGAEAAVGGKRVGINYLLNPAGLQDRNLAEAPHSGSVMTDNDKVVVEHWTPNPFDWVYMKRGGKLDIGVMEAVRLLERAGKFGNKVKIAVVDGGFGDGTDFPVPYEFNKASLAALDPTERNRNKCGNAECPWHGWNVANAAVGQIGNGIGAAGPAGPVASLLAIRRSADIFNNLQALTIALFSGAKIINMSYSARVPAIVAWSLFPYDLATQRAHGAGKLLIASAGNDSEDINEEDCFIFCWEAAWVAPCENGGVLCVGAMDAATPVRRSDSNYGDAELDMWGPGSVWVGGDYDNNLPQVFTATSAAAPFITGVAALIWAADPARDNEAVERIMIETAHHGGRREIERWPNAYAAVVRALGGTAPEIAIDVRRAGVQDFAGCRSRFQFTATVDDPDDGPPTVTWTSDIDGVLGTGTAFTLPLSQGPHRITATAVDGRRLATRSNEVFLQAHDPGSAGLSKPTVNIISLTNHQRFAANQNVTLEAGGTDPGARLGQLLPASMRWVSSKDGELGTGQRLSRALSPGAHFITLHYTGHCGGSADDLRLVEVTPALADAPPNMLITTPGNNDLVLRADATGRACLRVAGYGYDEEDKDFATIERCETNRGDLQWKVLSFEQNTEVCLRRDSTTEATLHEVRLLGTDRNGHRAFSAPLRVSVLRGLN